MNCLLVLIHSAQRYIKQKSGFAVIDASNNLIQNVLDKDRQAFYPAAQPLQPGVNNCLKIVFVVLSIVVAKHLPYDRALRGEAV